jgi:hypothetical protein
MDPQAALDSAEASLEAGKFEDAKEYLGNYLEWRRKGGFEPKGGDAHAHAIAEALKADEGPRLSESPSLEDLMHFNRKKKWNWALEMSDDGPSLPKEVQIWNQMSGDKRAEVMKAVGMSLGGPKKYKSDLAALRAVHAYIKKNLDKYKLEANYAGTIQAAKAAGASSKEAQAQYKAKDKEELAAKAKGMSDEELAKQWKIWSARPGYGVNRTAKEALKAEMRRRKLPLKTEASEKKEVADIILKQLGGGGKVRAMLGAKSIMAIDKGLVIVWPNKEKSKGDAVEITLRPDDTYDMVFFRVSSKEVKKKYEMVYADQLKELFEKWTGWALSL